MSTYIVIKAQKVPVTGGEMLLYNDATEKFFDDGDSQSPTPSEQYEEYLRANLKHDEVVVRYELDLLESIDISALQAADARKKITQQEYEALKNEVLNQ